MSDTSTITIETTARGLHALLDPVLPFADKGDSMPVLATVRLCGKGKWVTATTTDRRRLAMQRREIAAPDGWSALVNVRDIKAIFATFKDTRANDPEMVLSFDGSTLRVEGRSMLSGGQFSAALTFDLYPSEYPEVGSLLTEAFGGTMQATSTSLNVAFLADFQQAARLNDPNMHFFVRDAKPCGIAIGDDFRAVIMPVRHSHKKGAEAFAWEGALFADPPKPKKESDDPSSSSRTKCQAVSA